jgi:RHS repeat-associated protein
MGISESITYNSLSGAWTFGNNTSLVVNSNGSVTYNKGDGGFYTFTPNGNGGYTPPPGVYLTLTENAGTGNFTIKDKYGSIYNYANGQPYQFTDRNNNTTAFAYNSNGQLATETDPSGRTLTYGYTNGNITSVTDPAGHTYTMVYQNGLLTTMTDPAGDTYTIGYDANGHPATFTDPLDRVTSFTCASGGQLQSYNDARSNGQNVYTTTFAQATQSNGNIMTTVTDPRGKSMYYYHNPTTGNLIEKEDEIGYDINGTTDTWSYQWDTWSYQWGTAANGTGNELMQSQDALGTTSYTYDTNGNVLTKITTVNSSDSIVDTMTYNSYSEVLTKKDNSTDYTNSNSVTGREIAYVYDSHGNQISTYDPNLNEFSGNQYDHYGNLIEQSPEMLEYPNLILNGTMANSGSSGNLLANWSQGGTAVTVSQDSSWAPNGNCSLKIANATSTSQPYCYFHQSFSMTNTHFNTYYGNSYPTGDDLTLRADIQLDNVTGYATGEQTGNSTAQGEPILIGYSSGLLIGFCYADDNGDSSYDYYEYTSNPGTIGTTSTTAELSSYVPYGPIYVQNPNDPNNPNDKIPSGNYDLYYHVIAFVGLNDSSGTAWFSGVQLLDGGSVYASSAFNSVQNGNINSVDGVIWNNGTGTDATSGTLTANASSNQFICQNVPVHGGEPLTLAGLISNNSASGSVYYEVSYYDSGGNFLSSVQTSPLTGTIQTPTRVMALANAPAGAYSAQVQCVLTPGSGSATFTDVKLMPVDSVQNTYDAKGNYMISSEDAMGDTTQYTYDPNTGNELSTTDPSGNTTSYSYDSLNHLIQVKDPLGHNSYYQYDADGNLIDTRDPRSASSSDNTYATQYTYNNLNQLATLTDPLVNSTNYTYDASGNLAGVTQPNNMSETMTYDNANRLSTETLSTGQSYSYSYDGASDLAGVTEDNGASYTYAYDGAHRVKKTQDPNGYTINYAWDNSGNLVGESCSDNTDVNYTYDGDNNLCEASTGNTYIDYTYADGGQGSGVQYKYFNDTLDNEGLDPLTTTGQRMMTYLPNGWPSGIQDSFLDAGYSYSYNPNGTISSYTSVTGVKYFTYDSDGRLTWWNGNDGTSYQCNKANEITNSGFTYDANGNMTSDGKYNYTYNALNQLIQVNNVSSGGLVATYAYNHDGTRRSKTVYTSGSPVTTDYDWDASSNLVKESGGPNGTYNDYYASGKLIAYLYDNQVYVVHDDQRGDIVSYSYSFLANGDTATDSGTINDYDPWGNGLYGSGISSNFGYAGYYYDAETGLYYLKSRYYDPALGRFLTRDSEGNVNLGDPQTLNLYEYAGDNPVSNVDPNGNWEQGDQYIEFNAQETSEMDYYGEMYNESTTAAEQAYWHGLAHDIRQEAMMNEAQSWVMGMAGGGAEDAEEAVAEALRFTDDQQALVALAKWVKNVGGCTEEEAQILLDWADECGLYARGIENHINRNFNVPHFSIGPVNHIPII